MRIHPFLWVDSFSEVFLGIWKLAGLWLGMREMLQSDITEYFYFGPSVEPYCGANEERYREDHGLVSAKLGWLVRRDAE